MRKTLFLCAALLACSFPPVSAGDLEFFDFERASLAEVINIRTSAASRLAFAVREAPGMVTVITREELKASGARTVFEALEQVPGLQPAVDVEGLLGLGVRGNWAHEGKLLLLVDGQRYNEPFFGTAQLERVSVEQVERIEVIRGPGSAVYGGFAGLGVIKITTRQGRSLAGAEAAASYRASAAGAGFGTLNLAYGSAAENRELTAQYYQGGGDRSGRPYTDFGGTSYSLNGASAQRTRNFNLGWRRSGWELRLIADEHRTWQRDYISSHSLPSPLARNFDAYFAQVGREFRLGDALTLTPSVNLSLQRPYNGYDPVYYQRDKESDHYRGTLSAVYAASSRLRFSAGLEASEDKARLGSRTLPAYLFSGGRYNSDQSNFACFAEGVAETPAGTFSAGARYDRNQHFAPAFSPRIAWSRAVDEFHLKAMYSRAFRAPGIDNLVMNPDLDPEIITVTEAEAGYRPVEHAYLSAGVFEMRVDDPIVYRTLNGSPPVEVYENFGRTGTRGAELTARVKGAWGHANLSYSYYRAIYGGPSYFDSGARGELLGFSPHKLAASAGFHAGKMTFTPSLVYYSGARSYCATGRTCRNPGRAIAGVYAELGRLPGGAEAGAGIYDIFDSGRDYLQPYDGKHAPLPDAGRELRLRLAWKF